MFARPSSLAALLVAAGTCTAQVQPMPAPDPGITATPVSNPATAATIADIAARARAAREAPAVVPPATPAIQPLPAAGPFPPALFGSPVPALAREPGEPRLLSIAGRPGQERIEITFDGVIYTVSLRHPNLGTTGWRLTQVDAADSTVRIDNEAIRPRGGKGREATPAPSGYTISFNRRDPEFTPAPSPAAAAGFPAPMMPSMR